MIGMTITQKGQGGLERFADVEAQKMANRITNLWAENFAEYVRVMELSGQVLDVQTGETRESVGFFKFKGAKASYAVRPGAGISGHLNYLAGMQRGMLAGRGRKVIIRPKPFMRPGFSAWKASGAPRNIQQSVYGSYLDRCEQEFATSLEAVIGDTE